MEDIADKINRLAAAADEETKEKLVVMLRKAADSMEPKVVTVHRFGHLYMEAAMIETGMDLGLFKYFAEADGPKTLDEVAQHTGADPQLLKRILRYYNTINVVEATNGSYVATNITRNLNEQISQAGLRHYYGICKNQFSAYPSFLKEIGYKNAVDEKYTAFHKGQNTDLSAFQWLGGDHEQLQHLQTFMGLRCQTERSWLDVYPLAKEVGELTDPEKPLFVNVGGGDGQRCVQFMKAFPDLPGRIVLQDLPFMMGGAPSLPNLEVMPHDVLGPQPVKGAKLYYMRSTPHTNSPANVKKMFQHIKEAMTPDSIFLLDETVFPENDVRFTAASVDLTMLGAFASEERTEREWRELIESVGLELVSVREYYSYDYECIMDIRLPRSS
jgi:hypothetical protein